MLLILILLYYTALYILHYIILHYTILYNILTTLHYTIYTTYTILYNTLTTLYNYIADSEERGVPGSTSPFSHPAVGGPHREGENHSLYY